MVMLKPVMKLSKPRMKKGEAYGEMGQMFPQPDADARESGQHIPHEGTVMEEIKPYRNELSGTVSPHMKSARTEERQRELKKSVLEEMPDAYP